jgi:hypothetical protein
LHFAEGLFILHKPLKHIFDSVRFKREVIFMRKWFIFTVIILVLLLASCASKDDVDNSTSQLDDYEVFKTRAEVTKDDFIYRLVTEKGEYHKNDTIRIYAELEYIGDNDKVTIYHSASPFYFHMVEKTRNYEIHYPMDQPLLSSTLIKGKPLRQEYNRSGGYDSEGPEEYVSFMKEFLKNGFPSGYYVMTGLADFYVKLDEDEKERL